MHYVQNMQKHATKQLSRVSQIVDMCDNHSIWTKRKQTCKCIEILALVVTIKQLDT